MASEVAVKESAVPALAPTPSFSVTAADIVLPRMYVGQFMSKAVQSGIVKAGTIYAGEGGDDPDPQILWEEGDDPLLVSVLDFYKGKSAKVNNEFVVFDFDDPAAPFDAAITWNYSLAIPSADEDVPFKWTLSRSGEKSARRMNTVIAKLANRVPAYDIAFGVTTVARENSQGKFYVAQISHKVEPPEEHLAVTRNLAAAIAPRPAQATSGELPRI